MSNFLNEIEMSLKFNYSKPQFWSSYTVRHREPFGVSRPWRCCVPAVSTCSDLIPFAPGAPETLPNKSTSKSVYSLAKRPIATSHDCIHSSTTLYTVAARCCNQQVYLSQKRLRWVENSKHADGFELVQ